MEQMDNNRLVVVDEQSAGSMGYENPAVQQEASIPLASGYLQNTAGSICTLAIVETLM